MLTGEGALDVRRAEVDGIPVLWLPLDGPLTAGLHLRVGRADAEEPWSLWITAGLGLLAAVVIVGAMLAGSLSVSLGPLGVGIFGIGVVLRNLVRTREARGLSAQRGPRRR